jgi:hypothetical protein
MSARNITPIRRESVDPRERENRLELTGHLMRQAVQAAVLLIEDNKEPQVAADVLRLARDRWDSVAGAAGGA